MNDRDSKNRKVLDFDVIKTKKETEEGGDSSEDCSFERYNLNIQIEGVAAQLTGLQVSCEFLSLLVQQEGTTEEKKRWQSFERRLNSLYEEFIEFWEEEQ